MSDHEIATQIRHLQTLIGNEDYNEIIPVVEALLTLRPNDADFQHIYITSLIHSSQFPTVIKYLSSLPSSHPYQHQYIYALYRNKQHAEAATMLAKIKDSEKNMGVWHLEAQLNYRAGNYQRAADIYQKQFKPEDMDSELATNVLAAYAAAGRAADARTLLSQLHIPKDELTYEVAYNTACVWIEAGNMNDAEQELKNAEKMARESLQADDAEEDEITNEIAGIRVQHAYVLQCKGYTEEALTIYNDVINQKPRDTSVVATASNNIITLRKPDEKLFDSLKRSTKATNVDDEKLSVHQRQAIHINRCLLFLWGKSNDKALTLLSSLQKEYPDHESVSLVAACLYYRMKQVKKCEDTLRAYITSHPNTSLHSQLTLAHIPLLKGDIKSAIASLESLSSIKHKPGIIATLVALYERIGDSDGAIKTLNYAIEEAKKQSDKRHMFSFIEKLAEFQSRSHPRDATTLYEQLIKEGPADRKQEYLAKLVLAYAKFDVQMANKWASQLPPVKTSSSINIATLESSPPPTFERKKTTTKLKKEITKDGDGDVEMKEKPKSSKKRVNKKRKRLPKGFDPSNPGPPPDPERWLPKQERSTYKKGRKRHQKMTGAQGASAGADASLDAAARAEAMAASNQDEGVLTGKAAKPVNANPMSAAAKKAAAKKKGKKGRK